MQRRSWWLSAPWLLLACHAYDDGLLPPNRAGSVADASNATDSDLVAANGGALGAALFGMHARAGSTADAGSTAAESSLRAGQSAGAPQAGSDASGAGTAGSAGRDGAHPAGSGGDSAADGGASAATGGGGSGGGGDTSGNNAGDGASSGSAGTSGGADACAQEGGSLWNGNGHCYFVLSAPTSWNVGRDDCARRGATLVTISSSDEQGFVASLVGASPCWIGLARFGAPQFTWIDGSVVSYSNWEPGYPRVSGDAGVSLRDGTLRWIDEPVTVPRMSICER